MEFRNAITTDLGFDQAVERTRAALAEQGFGVPTEIDVQATLKNRLGQDIKQYLILRATLVQALDPQVMVSLPGLPDLPEPQPVADEAAKRLHAVAVAAG